MPKFIISPFTGKFDATASDSDITSVGDSRYLLLDQSTPQNITGGQPDFNAGLRAGSTDQLSIDASGNVTTSGLGVAETGLASGNVLNGIITTTRSASAPATYFDKNGVIQVTTTSNVARVSYGYYDTTGWHYSPYLMNEAAGTNLLTGTDGTAASAGLWTGWTSTLANATITNTQVAIPELTSIVGANCQRVQLVGGSTTGSWESVSTQTNNGSIVQNDVITTSIYLRSRTAYSGITGIKVLLRIRNSSTVYLADYASNDLKDEITTTWRKFSFTSTVTNATAYKGYLVVTVTGVSQNDTFDLEYYAPQIEKNPYPTSFIPTTTATLTRGVETFNTSALTQGTNGGNINFGASPLLTTGTLGAGAITGTSFIIGANTLNTSEWAFLDGQDQAVLTTSSPQFANLILTGGGNIYPSADSTTALGIASFAAPTVKLFSFDSTNKGFLMTDAVNLTAGQAGTTLSLARSVSGDYTAIAITNSNGLDAGISFNHTNGWGTITTAMSGIRSTRTNRVSSTDTDIGFMTNSGFVRAVRFKVRDDGMIYMIGGKGIYPSADSTTAWGVYKADATTNVMNIDTNNARVGIGTTAPVSLLTLLGGSNITPSADSTTALGIASFAAPTTKWVTFDTTNKRLGIGKTPLYQLEIGIGNDYATQAISCFSDTVAHNPYLTFIKSRNDTVGTLTETIDTDVIGSLLATGVNSSSTVATGAGIKFVQAGAAGATYVPIDISFQTGTNAAARTERMKIDNAGNITVGTASTNTMTMTARFIPRTTASDPQHVTAGSRPAGTVGEIAYYNGKWYGCTNAATPLWEKITSL
jgi:hypothetical protein